MSTCLSLRYVLHTLHKNFSPQKNLQRAHSEIKMLDIGCGYEGKLLVEASPHIGCGIGLDSKIDRECDYPKNLEFIEGDLHSSLSFLSEKESFDFVTMINVLEHLDDPKEVLTSVFALLKPGGIFYVLVPSWFAKPILEFLYFKIGSNKNEFNSLNEHKQYYNKRDLYPLLVKVGFKPSDIHMKWAKFFMSCVAVCHKKEEIH